MEKSSYWYSLKGGYSLQGTNNINILMIPDFALTAISLMPMAQYLNRLGYSVQVITLAGHEAMQADSLLASDAKTWVSKARQSYQALLEKGDPVYLVGVGLGAAIASVIGSLDRPSGLFLINPLFRLNPKMGKPGLFRKNKLIPLERPILPNRLDSYLFGCKDYYLNSLKQVQAAGKLAFKAEKELLCQIFFVTSRKDSWADNKAVASFIKKLGPFASFDQKEFQDADHLIYLGSDSQTLTEMVDRFIERCEQRASGIANDDAVVATAGGLFDNLGNENR